MNIDKVVLYDEIIMLSRKNILFSSFFSFFVITEVKELQSYFKAKIYRFPRSKEEVGMYKDGGIAIIDQWIAAHARFVISVTIGNIF